MSTSCTTARLWKTNTNKMVTLLQRQLFGRDSGSVTVKACFRSISISISLSLHVCDGEADSWVTRRLESESESSPKLRVWCSSRHTCWMATWPRKEGMLRKIRLGGRDDDQCSHKFNVLKLVFHMTDRLGTTFTKEYVSVCMCVWSFHVT